MSMVERKQTAASGRCRTVSQVLRPFFQAYSSSGRASSSFMIQSCHLLEPQDMPPMITLLIFSPDFPSLHGTHSVSHCLSGS